MAVGRLHRSRINNRVYSGSYRDLKLQPGCAQELREVSSTILQERKIQSVTDNRAVRCHSKWNEARRGLNEKAITTQFS